MRYLAYSMRVCWMQDDRYSTNELAIIISYPTSASGIIVLLTENNQEILLDLADFDTQEQPEDN